MPTSQSDAWDRDRDLDRIRATYAGYEATDRARIWSPTNRGYAMLAQDLRARVVHAVAASLPATGGRVLDLGCGPGDLLADVRAAGLNPGWVGVDLRKETIAQARSRYPDARFEVASADDVAEGDATFDVVVAQLLFSSLPSVALSRAVMVEIERLLIPGGWLVWSDLRMGNPGNDAVHGIPERGLRRLFPGWRVEVRRAGLVPPIARRLGPTAPALYPVLAAVPWLRSHLVGRLQPPGSA